MTGLEKNDLNVLIKRTLIRERIHYTNVKGVECSYYVPTGIASTIGNMALFWGEQSTLKSILDVIEDGNNLDEVKEYIKSRLNKF